MDVQAHDRFRAVDGLDRSEVPDGYVIYDQSREQVHFLNVAAAAILELCDGGRDVGAIAENLREAFDLPEPPVADISACLESLIGQGLVEPCAPSSFAA